MNRLWYLLIVLFVLLCGEGFSQPANPQTRYQVAIFTPLYLDSAFDDLSNYQHGMNFPKYINPGLEFYEGCLMAIDSLDREGIPLDISVFDTRSANSSVQRTLSDPAFDSIDLIIGHVNGSETKAIANYVANKDIPFINATYPNDAGVSNNPNYIILNSTLFTHCNAIYKYIQKHHSLNKVVFFRKKSAQEDRLQGYFEEITKNTNAVPLKITYVSLDENFSANDIRKHLSSDKETICIAGSLDIGFGQQIAQQLASLSNDAGSTLFGMPNWWDVAEFVKPQYKGITIVYTTPFYLSPAEPVVVKVVADFRTKYISRPTDMVYRGYETLYHFAHLLHSHGKNFGNALSEKRFRLFNDFDIQPVINPKTTTLDYFENKKIYFVKKLDGVVTAVY